MKFQNFLDRLMSGDVRAFVALALLALLLFVLHHYAKRKLRPYLGYIKLMAVLLAVLMVYTWTVHPERINGLFDGIVGWIAGLVSA